MRTIIITALVIFAVSTLARGLSPEIESLKNDYVIHAKKTNGHRLAGWTVLYPKNVTCDMTRPKIKTFGYCWDDENTEKGIDTTKERGWVKEAIQQWEKCGGMKFVEEETCRMGPDFVKIRVGSYRPQVVPSMDYGTCTINGFNMWLDFYTFGDGIANTRRTEKILKSTIQMYTLHEFGHFLGFDHEHNRNDRGKDDCSTEVDETVEKGVFGNYHITKDYDLDSIMNYCRPYSFYKPYLSEQDKKAVQKVYGGGNAKECEAVTKPWRWSDGEGVDATTLMFMQREGGYAKCVDMLPEDQCLIHKDVGNCKNPGMDYWCYKGCGFCK